VLQPASYDFVVAVTTHPRNWRWIVEDGVDQATYAPPLANRIYLAHGDQGYIAVERVGHYTWAFHIAMLPKAKGVKEFAEEVMNALVLIFGARKFISLTPADNKAALRLVRSVGGIEEGRLTKTYFRNGKMNDVIIYGVTCGN